MKHGKRIAAFALSLVVATGSVCYRPPKAKAYVGGMLANMCLSTFMTASGISLVPDDATAERLVNGLNSLVPDFVDDYVAEVGEFTADMFNSVIEQDCVIQTTGLLQIGHQAAALMGRFTAWLIYKFCLIGEDGVPVTAPVEVLPARYYIKMADGSLLYAYSNYNWVKFVNDGTVYNFASGNSFYFENDYAYFCNSSGAKTLVCAMQSLGAYSMPLNSNSTYHGMYDLSGEPAGGYYSSCSSYGIIGSSCIYNGSAVNVSISPDYEAAPDVDEQHAMVVDTGLTFEDEQSYIDAVLNGVAAGTLSPTYTIESTTAGDVTVPGEDAEDDTQVGILNWTKKIWQSVVELPQTIANAVANVFVPSEEYLAALPETVTAAFDGRTGFLTYPASVLYDFADMLTSGSEDFILEWPDVREPTSKAVMLEAGEFNVSKFVRDNDSLSDVYVIYQYVVGAYLTFLFLGLCRRKYNSVIGDRLGG